MSGLFDDRATGLSFIPPEHFELVSNKSLGPPLTIDRTFILAGISRLIPGICARYYESLLLDYGFHFLHH